MLFRSQLREHRRKGVTNIEKLEQGSYVINQGKKHEKRYDAIPNIRKFIEASGFVLSKENELTDEEVKYLTGGWFEEYVYNEIKEQIKPDDILIGVDINQTKETNNNDLDVVFTKGNKLFVIECKTGIHKIEFKGGNSNKSIVLKGEEAMFKEIAYKAASIKATLLRLPGNSFICSLSDGNEKFKQSAKNMGIDYYDRSYFTKIEKWKEFIADINRIAKD